MTTRQTKESTNAQHVHNRQHPCKSPPIMRPRTAHATQSDTIECECEMTSQSHHHERRVARTVTRHLRGEGRFRTLPTTPSPTLHWRASSHCLIRTAITSFLRPVGRWEPFRKNSTTCQRKNAASGGATLPRNHARAPRPEHASKSDKKVPACTPSRPDSSPLRRITGASGITTKS